MKKLCYITILLILLSVFATPALTQDDGVDNLASPLSPLPVAMSDMGGAMPERFYVSTPDAGPGHEVRAMFDELWQTITVWLERY